MKVKFKHSIQTYSGKIDEMVYGSYRHGNLCIGREYVYPRLTDNNFEKGAILKNLASVYKNASDEYKADLKIYCLRNSVNIQKDKLVPTAFSIFLKLMYGWYESNPQQVDLTTVTLADIVTMDADVRTIFRAVEAGFLASIPVYDDLTSDIQ